MFHDIGSSEASRGDFDALLSAVAQSLSFRWITVQRNDIPINFKLEERKAAVTG